MADSRKRKHAVSEEDPISKQPTSVKTQKNIKAFASVSKVSQPETGTKKRKTIHHHESAPPMVTVTQPTPSNTERKRKRERVSDAGSDTVPEAGKDSTAETSISGQHVAEKDATPCKKRFRNAVPPSPAETPSKHAAALFDKLKLGSRGTAIPFALAKRANGYDTPPDTPENEESALNMAMPTELHDVLQLHTAFLTTLSLYYAHNGASSPAIVSVLLPMITKSWNKRDVTLEDVRRLLAVYTSGFVLLDYGKAGLCLGRAQPRGRALKRAASYIDEDGLNVEFDQALQRSWQTWLASAGKENCTAATFINGLPLAEIVKHESTEKAAPLFARGEQRLAELKAGQAAAQSEVANDATNVRQEQKTATAIHNRGTSLLDRVLAKQAVTASLPAGPTKAQLERRAALHRVEDITRVLNLLAAGKPRCSFSMPVMVQRLQQSLRNPISKDEVERCLELMAKEVTPGYVAVVQAGAVKGVVVSRIGMIGSEELQKRLANAGA